ncbi:MULTISPECIES: recombinase family protein [Pseudomonas]|uniref:recombinase family protein n=1 Tax=Pseudomonas TaxID=286 RepID=UPI0010C06942|nr:MULTISPECIES: recombinase family protein [Pseudomonas]
MARTFAYCRVSTADQTTENQLQEIRAAGFDVPRHRVFSEAVSGSIRARQRAEFASLLDRLEEGDLLVVTKLDRLGRNAIDVQYTVEELQSRGIRVICLALGQMDLSSSAGKMTMGVLAAVAQFERDLIVERTQAGLARAKAEGKKLGRPVATGTAEVVRSLRPGRSQSEVAKLSGLSLTTVKRYWNVMQ